MVTLFVRRLARSPKRNKRKVVSGSRVTLLENFAYKPELSFNPLARVTLAVGLPYLLVNRALMCMVNRNLTYNLFGPYSLCWVYTLFLILRMLFFPAQAEYSYFLPILD